MTAASFPQSSSTVYIGNLEILDSVRKLLERKPSINFKLDPALEKYPDRAFVFGRDWRIKRLDGLHLIPYAFHDITVVDEIFPTLMTIDCAKLVTKISSTCHGRGVLSHIKKFTCSLAQELEIPYIEGITSLEGGNVFIIKNPSSKIKAIVGNLSLSLSAIAIDEIENEGICEALKLKRDVPIDFYRLASNVFRLKAYYNLIAKRQQLEEDKKFEEAEVYQKELTAKFRSYKDYRASLLDQPAHEELLRCKKLAEYFFLKFAQTREKIAQDLSLKIEEVLLIPQTCYHLDFEIAVSPRGYVLVHDEETVISELSKLKESATSDDQIFSFFLEGALNRLKANQEHVGRLSELFLKHSVPFKKVPGLFKGPHFEDKYYFLNGLFFEEDLGETFVTSASKFEEINLIFKKALEEDGVEVKFLPYEIMNPIFIETKARLRCFSWEH